jgi:hypothetical protein
MGRAALLDGGKLAETMKAGEPCCVIDAREEGRRKQQPIFALVIARPGWGRAASWWWLQMRHQSLILRRRSQLRLANRFMPQRRFDVWRKRRRSSPE